MKTPTNYQEVGERHGTVLPQVSEGTNPADALISDFWPPEL